MDTALWRHGARELAALVADGSTSSREVVEAHLDRIAEVGEALGAVVEVLAPSARAAADAADAAVAAGARLGPLHGVPFTVKQNIDVAGSPTAAGTRALADAVPAHDAPVVARLRAAGAVPLARTNMPDLGLRVETVSELHGPTRNPWDAARSAGGSSGGEAAALATGCSPLGLGNDLGGSLRNPAHCCGIASLKPSTGLVPSASSLPGAGTALAWQLMAVQGVMARRVADVRTALHVVAGQDPRDPHSLPLVPPPAPPGVRRRVAVLADPPGGPSHPGVVAAVERAAGVLADAGHTVRAATPPRWEETLALWAAVLAADLRHRQPELAAVLGPQGRAVLDATLAGREVLDPAGLHALHVARDEVLGAWSAWHVEHEVLLCPVWSHPAPALGFDLPGRTRGPGEPRTHELFRAVLPANLLGSPAAAVPVGLVDGLPVAVQVLGPRGADLVCLAVAEELEATLGLPTPIDPRPAGSSTAA